MSPFLTGPGKTIYDDVNEIYALAMAVQSVIEHHSLNSSQHPLWTLAEMLVERTNALGARISE